jgi:hypothetical protein
MSASSDGWLIRDLMRAERESDLGMHFSLATPCMHISICPLPERASPTGVWPCWLVLSPELAKAYVSLAVFFVCGF